MSGCSSAPPSPAPQIIRLTCQGLTPCQLPPASPASPANNGDLLDQLTQTEAAWASCAAKVDSLITCQQRQQQQGSEDGKAKTDP
ncbi:Rz1-like lysis system protein LysC [Aeromonas salmonicida]|uniref:Rz1-like lysis system protein LysC n=1 Tax=Aeromonas salmonicida TaxID=645 RepID=UPI00240D30A2|nr:Rz1-like lysis system protein LysC [Aeromonas salmonicida]WFC12711.1 Rz1-like lysis system protein LysC [Aeromonas salmonicida]